MNRKGRYYKIRNPGSMQSYEFVESVHQQLDKISIINIMQKEKKICSYVKESSVTLDAQQQGSYFLLPTAGKIKEYKGKMKHEEIKATRKTKTVL